MCRGHLQWLVGVEKASDGCFAANYRITGKIIAHNSGTGYGETWTAPDALTDVPFQILKATQFLRVFGSEKEEHDKKKSDNKENNDKEENVPYNVVASVMVNWLTVLDKIDKRGKFAWPHRREEDANVFRLDDHIWILLALKSISVHEDHFAKWRTHRGDVWVSENVKVNSKFDSAWSKRRGDITYTFQEFEREVFRRFTTENENSRTRMLAVTRSPRETRFFLHARDTVFFYGQYWGLIQKDSPQTALWERTLDIQQDHREDDDKTWDNALRFGLAALLGSRQRHIKNSKSPNVPAKPALLTLFRSSGVSGFFPGQLDDASKIPKLFDEERWRDFYFHASFEVPFLLLTHARRFEEEVEAVDRTHTSTASGGKSGGIKPEQIRQILHHLGTISETLAKQRRSHSILGMVSLHSGPESSLSVVAFV